MKKHVYTITTGVWCIPDQTYQDDEPVPEQRQPLNLIEQMEQQTGQRWDSNGGDNRTMDSLFGAMSRVLGNSHHRPEDDPIAGLLIRHEMSPAGQAQKEADTALVRLLTIGVGPDEVKLLTGR